MQTLFDKVVEAGLEYDNHYSDLYIKVSDKARELLHAYPFGRQVKSFTGTDGEFWYEVPFAFDPFWQGEGKEVL